MPGERRIVAILQARSASTRLPGKVLAPLAGKPMLEQILRRLLTSRLISQLVVATTGLSQDDALAALVTGLGIPCYRGSSEDVLDRYYQAAQQFQAEIVVRLTGDNPLVDGRFVDWVIRQYLSANPPCEYMDTASSNSFPMGLSVEVFSFHALEAGWQTWTNQSFREHVTLHIRENPRQFRAIHLRDSGDNSDLRWTVDTPEDLERMRILYDALDLSGRILPYERLLLLVRSGSPLGYPRGGFTR